MTADSANPPPSTRQPALAYVAATLRDAEALSHGLHCPIVTRKKLATDSLRSAAYDSVVLLDDRL